MRLKQLFLTCLLMAVGTGVWAEKVPVGELYYNLDASSMTAEVTSLRDSPMSTNGSGYTFTEVVIPEEITYPSGSGNTYRVTAIGEKAFFYTSSLVSVTIPDGVTSIGTGAFHGCKSLAEATLTENSQLETIGEEAFAYCSSLTDVIIPNAVTTIGDYAFENCI